MRGQFRDLTGQRFGRLIVISRAENRNGDVCWNCVCDCGNKRVVRRTHLVSGDTLSCGCLIREKFNNYIHRFSDEEGERRNQSRLYGIWQSMRNRCYNKNSELYRLWGGRGIKICDEWKDDYKAFKAWSLGNGYRDDLSIDRINNDGDYSPDNCRWATNTEQMNNTRANVRITVGDETHTIAEWSYITGIPRCRLYKRVKYGITDERFLAKEKLTNVGRYH